MKALLIIMQREVLVRIRKRSFIILTLVGPIIFGLLSIIPAWLSIEKATEKKVIQVSSQDLSVFDELLQNDQFIFVPSLTFGSYQSAETETITDATLTLENNKAPALIIHTSLNPKEVKALQRSVAIPLYKSRLRQQGISDSTLALANTEPSWNVVYHNKTDKQKAEAIAGGIGMITSVLIYLFIFMYGIQVLRAVMEEKQSRIVEIIISSVKPVHLMAGKIAGIGLVCLIQFSIWIVLAVSISTWVQQRFQLDRFNDEQIQHTLQQIPDQAGAMEMHEMMSAIDAIPFTLIISCFLAYFLFSYLLYASLFAAVGSMIDHESDQQTFTLPITAPLIITFVMATNIMGNPDSSMAYWFSVIPFTSPIAMMLRIPFGVPMHELLTSLTLLIATSVGAMYFSGKIYRTGILMYGKKASWKEVWHWIRMN